MGKVYSWDDLDQERIPTQEDQIKGASIVLQSCAGLFDSGLIDFGLIYGSFSNPYSRTFNERSDCDLVLSLTHPCHIFALVALKRDVMEQTRVDIDSPFVIDRYTFNGIRRLDDYFISHFRRALISGSYVGNPNILDSPLLANKDPLDVHTEYLENKVEKFGRALFLNHNYLGSHDLVLLQRILELPINLGRRHLEAYRTLGHEVDLSNDSKPKIIELFQEHFAGTELISNFLKLLQEDKEYTEFLRSTIKGSVSRDEYEQRLIYIREDLLPIALLWVHAVIDHFITERNKVFS